MHALLFAAFVFSAPGAKATNTIEGLYELLKSSGATTKEAVLAALPEELKRNYVLVKESRSRQAGTPELPRVIHFTKSADLIVSSSGHTPDTDFASNDLEVLQLDREKGTWRTAMIHFDGAGVHKPVLESRVCNACHGESPRPRWGGYLDWPTAYGGSSPDGTENMADKELEQFRSFVEAARTHEGYRHLVLELSERGFLLPGSSYGYPNTVFTSRVGMRQAEVIFVRLKRSPLYAKLRLALVASSRGFCPNRFAFEAWVKGVYADRLRTDGEFRRRWENETPELPETRLLRLLGIDPVADLALDEFPRGGFPLPHEERVLNWNLSADYMISVVNLLVLRDAWATDPNVQRLVGLRATKMELLFQRAFASNEALSALDNTSTGSEYFETIGPYIEPNVLRPLFTESGACDYFTQTN